MFILRPLAILGLLLLLFTLTAEESKVGERDPGLEA
jgi:hypothetical protein